MDASHPNQWDSRPKRRKNKDNPYELLSVGAATDYPHFFVRFKDSLGQIQCLEISRELFEEFDHFELEDLAHLNEVDRHYEHSELKDETLSKRDFRVPFSLETEVTQKLEAEELRHVILKLPDIQRRRLMMYYFDELTHQQIAELEGCSQPAVAKSIAAAIANLKKMLDTQA